MDHCIVASGNSMLHLHARIMASGRPTCRLPLLAVEFYVSVPGASHHQEPFIFNFHCLPTALPYRDWEWVVADMILTAAGHNAPTLHLAQLVIDFCTYTRPALVRFRASPGNVLFLSAVVEVTTDTPPRRFYYYPFPGADLHVGQGNFYPVIQEAYQSGGGTPAPASPIRITKRVIFGGEVAAEGDGESHCAICLEEYVADDVLDELLCGHRFHPCCIVEWIRKHPTCPLCRMRVALDQQ